MTKSFTHLHLHTEYSMLDGASRVEEVVAAAAADGQPGIGITDHGNMYGVLPFYKAARKFDINPVIGTEGYFVSTSRFDRPKRSEHEIYHLTLLAETTQGYHNLIKIASNAFMEGYYYKPRSDWDLLAQYSEGVIATSGCLGGLVNQLIMKGEDAAAEQATARFAEIFGRDNFFIELQDHGLPEDKEVIPKLLDIARRQRLPLLATNDSHYTHQHDAEAHDALLCVQTGALMSDANRFKFTGNEFYLKSATEMRHLFREVPESCDNTLWIAERANVEIEFGNSSLPQFPVPEGHDEDSYLRELVFEGAKDRYGVSPALHVLERIEFELGVIKEMGFSAYFLVVWDLVRYAKARGIRVGPGRGSAAGSAVAYTLRIVDVDPIKYDLLFERFLNPGRKQMPDIDMDFDSRYRGEMIEYAAKRYGRDRVAQIVTFSTIKARAAVRDAARVLGFPYVVGDKIAKLMPPLVMGRDTPLYACLDVHPKYEDGYKMAAELRELYTVDPDARRVIDVAKGLEGLRRQDGIHAAAVVIARDPLTDYVPIQRKPGPDGNIENAPVVTQYEMNGVEELGLLKMDFLGLRNLDVMEVTLDLIEQETGERPDIDNVDLEDTKTFEMLQRGDSIGVFQFEGGPLRALMRSLAPTSFEDVSALVALYRPGPMASNMHTEYADRKNGRKETTMYHEDLRDVLGNTFGLCLTGDTVVFDAVSGLPTRLDAIDPKSGFYVQGVDEEFGSVVRPVTHWVNNGVKPVVEMRLTNGMAVTGTPDHQVLTDRGWREMGTLGPDDYIAVPHKLVEPIAPARIDRNRLRVLAYLIADGTLSVGAKAEFTSKDDDLIEEFRAAVAAAFPDVRSGLQVRSTGVKVVHTGNGGGNGGKASSLVNWLRDLGLKTPMGTKSGGCKSATKFVPEFVFGGSDSAIAFFLASLWDCDGYVGPRMCHYRTVSKQLARDVQLLLLRIGIDSVIHSSAQNLERNPGATPIAYSVHVHDGDRFSELIQPYLGSLRKRAVSIEVRTKGTTLPREFVAAAFQQSTGLDGCELASVSGINATHFTAAKIDEHPRIYKRTFSAAAADLRVDELDSMLRLKWVRVAGVTDAGECEVFDITVDDVHNFVANGTIVHNCIYQEQMMRMAQVLAGYSLAEADDLRKATGKKKRDLIAQHRTKFVAGCDAQGYGTKFGEEMFDIIEPFADYSFNKSHSVGYGYVSYQTAWLKANYPRQYLAALLTSVKGDKDKSAVYLNECRQLEIPVLVPDVNESLTDFSVVEGSIRFGMSAVRNVGEGLVSLLVEERTANGPFVDFYDFVERVDTTVLNKRTIESLIKAGGFDSFGHPRRGLLTVFEKIVDNAVARRRERDAGIMSLFGGGADSDDTDSGFSERTPIPSLEFEKREKLAVEKEMLGLYVSDHPLMGAERSLRRYTDATIAELRDMREGEMRMVGGVVTALSRKYTKKGDLMATFVLEDLASAIEVMVFPKTMLTYGELLSEDAVVCIKGRVDARDDQPKLIAMEVTRPELVLDAGPPVRLRMKAHSLTDDKVASLTDLLKQHPGDSQVFVHLEGPEQVTVLRLGDDFLASGSGSLFAELRVLFGPDCLL